jgi:hypothetical protein
MIALLQWYFERLRFWLIVMLGLTACGIGSAGIVWIFSNIFGKAVAEAYFIGPLSFCGFLIAGALAIERSELVYRLLFKDRSRSG